MIKSLISSFKTIGRVLKNIIIRPFRTAYAKIKYILSGRKLISTVPGMAKKLPKILKTKPEKREDYFDWGSVYVAKSLVLLILVIVIALPLLYIFLFHPLLTKWFWVKDFHIDDSSLSSYSGRVRVYYDEKFEELEFEGRLEEGLAVNKGEEYYENGRNKYVGAFFEGVYEGDGILYYDDGAVKYRGEFVGGRFDGIGEYTDENSNVYSGTFSKGSINGRGTLTVDGNLYYDGNFSDGLMNGDGKTFYSDGTVNLSGTFTDGVLNGAGLEYYSNGMIKYNGTFVAGQYNGTGVLYAENGKKVYSGSFEMGAYSGSGTLYGENGVKLYTGEFEDGIYSGSGTLYGADGSVTSGNFSEGEISGAAIRTFINGRRYEGCFSDNLMNGSGTLSDVTGNFTYSGAFLDNDFDYRTIIGAEPSAVKEAIPSLSQVVADDCFYLKDNAFGILIKCSFASGNNSAAVTEMYSKPVSGIETVISGEKDVNAPQASLVSKAEDEKIAPWAAAEFGIDADSVECYEAFYGDTAVYYWTDISTGHLLLKSAKITSNFSDTESTAKSEDTFGLSEDEITNLLGELGLDPADFASLGLWEVGYEI